MKSAKKQANSKRRSRKARAKKAKKSDGVEPKLKMDADSEDDDLVLDRLDNLEQETMVELDSKNRLGSAKLKKKFVPNFDIPGVCKVVLDTNSQISIGIRVGIDVTGLNAWKCVKKELLLDNVTVYGDDSAFAPFKADLEALEDDDVLMGYIFDECTDEDEFYACLTTEAREKCQDVYSKIHEKTMKKLERSVYRTSKPWESLGSEKDVDDFILKTNRPLIKVEVKTVFPRPNQPRNFQVRKPDDTNDAYCELLPDKLEIFDNVIMARIDAAVQAVPQKSDSEAQTEPKFPQNVWTQCSVSSNEVRDICAVKEEERQTPEGEQDKKRLKRSASKDEAAQVLENLRVTLSKWAPTIESMLEFNGVLDIYNMDYPTLKNQHETTTPDDFKCEEIMLFKSVKSKDKVVSSISWHPIEEDVFAVAYCDSSHVIKARKPDFDQVFRDVHGENPVLAWSVKDSLNPKLYFEADREVRTLSFCPYESNILVGGCANGQVILWDAMGKLRPSQGVQFLSKARKEFREYIQSNKGWMKEYDDSCIVRQAAASDLANGHRGAIKDIVWLEPKWIVDKGGKMNLIEDDSKSMQFITVALDGLLIIWDMKITDTTSLPTKVKSNRVDMDLSELGLSLSKYTVLNNWSPLFKVIVRDPTATMKSPLTCLAFKEPRVETTIEKSTDYRYPDKEITRIVHSYWLGTLFGDVFKITWAGQELESEDVLKDEYSKFDLKLTVHDGPITCCTKNPFFHDVFATVGGKVFAVWSDNLMGKPLFWKKMKYYLTHLAWSPHVPSQLFVTTQRGDVDMWEFTQRSDAPIKTQKISGDPLTGLYFSKASNEDKLVLVGDDDGTLRLLRLSESCHKLTCVKLTEAKKFFDRALEAQHACQEWQDKWFADHAEMIEKRKADELAQKKERDRQMRLKIRKEQERKELEEQKAKEVKVKVVDHEERWKKMQWRHAVRTIQEKKHLDKLKLLKEERPLKELEAEAMCISIKRIETLKRQELVFNETVSILFPQAVQSQEQPSMDVQSELTDEMRNRIMDDYKEVCATARKFMEENPYQYEFDWQKTLERGRERRRVLIDAGNAMKRNCPDWCPLKAPKSENAASG